MFMAEGCQTMVDLGCGPGGQVKMANELGMQAVGIDGDHRVNPDILHDFAAGPIDLGGRQFDLLWSVEFLEHVEERFAQNFVPVIQASRIVAITHAPPGKKRVHHVNCRFPPYWRGFMSAAGYIRDERLTALWRRRSSMRREFVKETGAVFVRVGN